MTSTLSHCCCYYYYHYYYYYYYYYYIIHLYWASKLSTTVGSEDTWPSSTFCSPWCHWGPGSTILSSFVNSDQLFLGLPLLTRPATLRHVMQLTQLWLLVIWLIQLWGVFVWMPATTLSNPALSKECRGCDCSLALCGTSIVTWISHFFVAKTDLPPSESSIHYHTALHSWHMYYILDSSPSGRRYCRFLQDNIGKIFLNLNWCSSYSCN